MTSQELNDEAMKSACRDAHMDRFGEPEEANHL
jgi:hypothetical protein